MMGASKRIMEYFLMRDSENVDISTARFANVAFSDGSLLHGFNQRIEKCQPIVAPTGLKRYFVTAEESGQLCLASALLGENRDIFFPNLSEELHSRTFSEIAIEYLNELGYEPYECNSEEEARELALELPAKKKWPVYFFESDTTGEKDFEEFFTTDEKLDRERFQDISIVKHSMNIDSEKLDFFMKTITEYRNTKSWTKKDLVNLFCEILPGFQHEEKGKYLDQKM